MVYSLLDNDLYKLTMAQCVYHNFTNVMVEYDFFNRADVDLRPYRKEIEQEIRQLDHFGMNPDEYKYLQSIRFLSKDFIDWFSNYKFKTEEHVFISETENDLKITVKGNWLDTIFYEVPILAIVSEVYHSRNGEGGLAECTKRLEEKIEKIKNLGNGFRFADFGTRRRYSFMIQDHVVGTLVRELPDNIVGTSNVYLAMKYGIAPIGTIAHELIQCSQQLFPLKTHQKDIMDVWSKEFEGDLGIMLSDTINTDSFLEDFNLKFAKLFDGVRQDSGNPYVIGEKIVKHYEKLRIDPTTKSIIFSDGLDIDKAIDLYNHFKGKIGVSFGIGTHLTNDCGDKPLSIVLKIQTCNGLPVAKISDSPGKTVCRNEDYINYLKSVFI